MEIEMDLADYLQPRVAQTSLRKVAVAIGISKTTVENIVKRKLKTMPELQTLERIADYSGFSLPVVVAMAGATMGDGSQYARLARELEAHPWITERFDELTAMSKEEFQETMDYFAYRREKKNTPHPPPPQDGDLSNP